MEPRPTTMVSAHGITKRRLKPARRPTATPRMPLATMGKDERTLKNSAT